MLECWSEVLVAQSGRQVSEDIDDRVMHELILMQGCAPGESTLFQKYKYTKKKNERKTPSDLLYRTRTSITFVFTSHTNYK